MSSCVMKFVLPKRRFSGPFRPPFGSLGKLVPRDAYTSRVTNISRLLSIGLLGARVPPIYASEIFVWGAQKYEPALDFGIRSSALAL